MSSAPTVFFQGIGERLTRWDVDVDAATLEPRDTVVLPSNVQYAWPHPSRDILYVTTSDAAAGNAPDPGKVHRLCAVRIERGETMMLHGEPAALPQRPIHNSVDAAGRYVLTCYNTPSNVTVHRIDDDGAVGSEVRQPSALDLGIYAHQIVTTPDNRNVILVTRGNRPSDNRPEDPGALKIFAFEQGRLTPAADFFAGDRGGLGYGPRHVDFHPAEPWIFVSVESQNELHMHRLGAHGVPSQPLHVLRSTVASYDIRFPQLSGAIHVHPNGRTVYISNRANATAEFNGRQVFRGGENNIAVFSVDQRTGEPRLIQHADPKSCHVRTFSIDPSGRLMVAASISDLDVRVGDVIRHVPAALTVFRIEDDGRLTFVRKYDVELGGKYQWWTGFAGEA